MSTAKELLLKIKALFDAPPAPPAPPATPAAPASVVFSYPVDGGSTVFVNCTDDGIADIDMGDPVFTDAAMTTPYPDGTYKVTGSDFGFTVAAGTISAVADADGTGPGAPLEQGGGAAPVTVDAGKTPPVAPPAVPAAPAAPAPPKQFELTQASIAAMFASFATGTPEDRIANLELVCKALMDSTFGWQIREAQSKANTDQAILIYKQDLVNAQAAALAKQDEKIAGMFGIMEKIVELPTADPVTLTGNKKDKFEKTEAKEKKLEGFAEAIKKKKAEAAGK